jgi:polygalacturonase
MWQIHPVLCTNVTVRGVQIHAPDGAEGPNTDGCDPESCRDVLIENCYFDTGDDCIAVNSGRNADGRRLNIPSENIVIRNCRMKNGHGGITMGSQCSGGIRNVFAERCTLDSPQLDFAVRLKNNALRGGTIEHIYVRDLTIGQVAKAALQIDFYYEEGPNGPFTPVARNIGLERISMRHAERVLDLRGFANAPIRNVMLADCDFGGVSHPNVVEHVEGLTLRNVKINGKVTS